MAKRSNNARDEQGRWDIGGGGLKWDNTAIDNAIREIEEEYSVTPLNISFLGYRDVFRQLPDGTPNHWLALDFIALVDRQKVKINEPEIFDDSGWFTLNNLPSPLHSQLHNIFNKYESELKSKYIR